MTNKITGNGKQTDLKALQAYYEALQAKKNEKDQKTEQKTTAKKEIKKVDVSALDATAAQIWGIQLTKSTDTSEKATRARMELAMKNDPFFKALNDLHGIEEDGSFMSFALANIKGVDTDKLNKHLNRAVSNETQQGVAELMNLMLA